MTEEIWVSFNDLQRVFRKKKKRIIRIALWSAGLLSLALLSRPSLYRAEAIFRLGAGKVEQSYDLKNVLQTLVSRGGETSAQSIFTSTPVMRRTIEQMGMQACVQKRGRVLTWLKNIRRNIAGEFSLSLPDEEGFVFQNVRYSGERPHALCLQPQADGSFVAEGTVVYLGIPCQIGDISLTLTHAPAHVKKETIVTIVPWKSAVQQAKKAFSIKSSKLDPHILSLTFADENRFQAAQFLNALMDNYQTFLKEEAAELSDVQLKYLDARQLVLQARLDEALQEHVAYLKTELDTRGFVGIHQEIETLSKPQSLYNERLFDIEFDLSHFTSDLSSLSDPRQIQLGQKLSTLSLEEKKLAKAQSEHLAAELQEMVVLLAEVEAGDLPSKKPRLFAPLIAQLEGAKIAAATTNSGADSAVAIESARHELAESVREFIHSLHLKQKTLEESSLYAKSFDSDFRGLSLETAKALAVQYHSQLDALHLALKQLLYLQGQVRDPSFDIGALINTGLDPITLSLVQKAAELEVQLHDDQSRSPREHSRLRAALGVQKKYIASHIAQTLDLHKIRIELTREKIAALQSVIADLLKVEKKLVEDKLSSLKKEMGHLPQKWRVENLLKIKKEMTESMLEGLSHITESKIINRHLYTVESRPLDLAVPPLHLQPARILILAISCALVAFVAAYFFFLTKGLLNGLSPSLEQLKRAGLDALGILSSRSGAPFSELVDDDRECIRKIAERILLCEAPSAALLLVKKSCDFSEAVADLLRIRGKNVVIVDCDVGRIAAATDIPGLWQYIHKETEEIAIRAGRVSTGGTTRLATEFFQKREFAEAVDRLKKQHDYVLLTHCASINSTEAAALRLHCSLVITAYQNETQEELLNWTRQKENQIVSFILNEDFS